MSEREWEPDERYYGADEQRDRDAEWDEHVRHQEQETVDRQRDRAGAGERPGVEVEAQTCSVCGERFWNLGGHLERCTGRRP